MDAATKKFVDAQRTWNATIAALHNSTWAAEVKIEELQLDLHDDDVEIQRLKTKTNNALARKKELEAVLCIKTAEARVSELESELEQLKASIEKEEGRGRSRIETRCVREGRGR